MYFVISRNFLFWLWLYLKNTSANRAVNNIIIQIFKVINSLNFVSFTSTAESSSKLIPYSLNSLSLPFDFSLSIFIKSSFLTSGYFSNTSLNN